MAHYYNNKKKVQQNNETPVDKVKEVVEKTKNVITPEIIDLVTNLIKEGKEVINEKKTTGKVSVKTIREFGAYVLASVAIVLQLLGGQKVDIAVVEEGLGLAKRDSIIMEQVDSTIKIELQPVLKQDSIYKEHLIFDSKGNLQLK